MKVKTFKNLVGNKFFTATFVKKDGSLRTMNARLGVKKHLNPLSKGRSEAHKQSLIDKGLVGVYEMGNHYRTLNLNTLVSLRVDGTTLRVED